MCGSSACTPGAPPIWRVNQQMHCSRLPSHFVPGFFLAINCALYREFIGWKILALKRQADVLQNFLSVEVFEYHTEVCLHLRACFGRNRSKSIFLDAANLVRRLLCISLQSLLKEPDVCFINNSSLFPQSLLTALYRCPPLGKQHLTTISKITKKAPEEQQKKFWHELWSYLQEMA